MSEEPTSNYTNKNRRRSDNSSDILNSFKIECLQDYNRYSRNKTTSSYSDIDINYLIDFPQNINLLKNAFEKAGSISDIGIKNQVKEILFLFQQNLIRLDYDEIRNIKFPPLQLSIEEDSSAIIEWLFDDFRIGFSLRKIRDESNWYFASKRINDRIRFGDLSNINKNLLIQSFILNVLKNV